MSSCLPTSCVAFFNFCVQFISFECCIFYYLFPEVGVQGSDICNWTNDAFWQVGIIISCYCKIVDLITGSWWKSWATTSTAHQPTTRLQNGRMTECGGKRESHLYLHSFTHCLQYSAWGSTQGCLWLCLMERALQVIVSSQSLHGILAIITNSEEEIGKAIAKVTPVSYSQKIVSFV